MTSLADLRREIDALDTQMIELLASRAAVVARVAELKAREGLPALIPDRVEEVITHVRALAIGQGLDPALAETVWRAMIAGFVAFEEQVLSKGKGFAGQARE
jgi:isochorismate pyruvate lyase